MDKVYQALSAAMTSLRLSPHSVQDLGHGVSRVVFSHVADPTERSPQDYRSLFASLSDGLADLVPETIEKVGEVRHQRVISGIAVANTRSVPYAEKMAEGKLKVVQADLMLDEADKTMWRVQGEGESRRLVQVASEDFNAMLTARMQRMKTRALASAEAAFAGTVPSLGQFAMVFVPASRNFGCGVVTSSSNGTVKLCSPTDEIEVPSAAVVACMDVPEVQEDVSFMLIARDADESRRNNRMLAYLKTLYGNTPFFEAYVKMATGNIAKRDKV